MDALGVDIGLINLALCRLAVQPNADGVDEYRVRWWAVIDLLGLERQLTREACANIPQALGEHIAHFADCGHVVIEQQPHYNVPMRIVSHALITYFHTLWRHTGGADGPAEPPPSGRDVPASGGLAGARQTVISSAANKLKPFEAEEVDSSSYYRRKKSAVLVTARLLDTMVQQCEAAGDAEGAAQHRELARWYVGLAKKDDAADALLHAYYYLKRQRALQSRASGRKRKRDSGADAAAKTAKAAKTARAAKTAKTAKAASAPKPARGPKPPEACTVAELKEQLRARSLPVGGRKAELLQRLLTEAS